MNDVTNPRQAVDVFKERVAATLDALEVGRIQLSDCNNVTQEDIDKVRSASVELLLLARKTMVSTVVCGIAFMEIQQKCQLSGQSFQEIVESMGISLRSVQRWMLTARRQLGYEKAPKQIPDFGKQALSSFSQWLRPVKGLPQVSEIVPTLAQKDVKTREAFKADVVARMDYLRDLLTELKVAEDV